MNLGCLGPYETSSKNFSVKIFNDSKLFTIYPAYELILIFKGNKDIKVK